MKDKDKNFSEKELFATNFIGNYEVGSVMLVLSDALTLRGLTFDYRDAYTADFQRMPLYTAIYINDPNAKKLYEYLSQTPEIELIGKALQVDLALEKSFYADLNSSDFDDITKAYLKAIYLNKAANQIIANKYYDVLNNESAILEASAYKTKIKEALTLTNGSQLEFPTEVILKGLVENVVEKYYPHEEHIE